VKFRVFRGENWPHLFLEQKRAPLRGKELEFASENVQNPAIKVPWTLDRHLLIWDPLHLEWAQSDVFWAKSAPKMG
jgi:hypothetical protein